MRVTILNESDISGGAARAAYRIHRALLQKQVKSQMLVNHADSGDWTVSSPISKLDKVVVRLRGLIGRQITKALRTNNPILHSPAILPSTFKKRLNVSDTDVVHLHWVNHEMLSIADIGRICKPIVWTLHDMWAFCGAEHYTDDWRWREGYTKNNRPTYETGFDLNLWVWNRKRRNWKKPMQIVTPSRWLADCARQSVLMCDWPITVIHNAIDTDSWQPVDKALARKILNLPTDVPLLLFGALGGSKDPRKGFDLLRSALRHLHGQKHEIHLVVFGQLAPREPEDLFFPVHYTGHLNDDVSLRLLYSAADIMVVPSRQESFGQTASEAIACGTPVVAFGATGLLDIVQHKKTGYLAKPFDTEDLAHGIEWVLSDDKRKRSLGDNARKDAVNRFSSSVIASQYMKVYEDAVRSFAG